MDTHISHSLLEFNPDTVEYIREIYNLHQPRRMEEALKILDDWIKTQAHFTKKDFSAHYLETTIIACKGSMERSKTQIDRYCTFRTLMPAFFKRFDVKRDAGNLYDILHPVILPKLTSDHYRVFLVKLYDGVFQSSQFMECYKICIIIAEYLKLHDYLNGFMVFVDLTVTNVLDLVTKLNPIELRQAFSILIEGYGMRLKGIHILTSSKFVDALITILKQILSEKLSKRIYVHRTMDTVFQSIPKEIIPAEYGGEERSVRELHEIWLDLLSSKEHLDYLDEQRKAATDESCRQSRDFNDQYAGTPGTFRALSVD